MAGLVLFWYFINGFFSDGQDMTDMVALRLDYSLQCTASSSPFFLFHIVTCVRLFLPLSFFSFGCLGVKLHTSLTHPKSDTSTYNYHILYDGHHFYSPFPLSFLFPSLFPSISLPFSLAFFLPFSLFVVYNI